MPSSTSWQRYDDEHNVSAIFTDAARACVVANPSDVTDYLCRYFRQVAGGTSVNTLECREVVGERAGPAATFTLELNTGPEVTITSCDLSPIPAPTATVTAFAAASKAEENKRSSTFAAAAAARAPSVAMDEDEAEEEYETVFKEIHSTVVPHLMRRRNVEPQRSWDDVLMSLEASSSIAVSATTTSVSIPLAIQWPLSMLASLAAAKQRKISLYQYLAMVLETQHAANPAGSSATARTQSNAKAAVAKATCSPVTGAHAATVSTSAAAAAAAAGGRHFSTPQLLLPFLVRDTAPDAPATTTRSVHFSKVYVGLELLTSGVASVTTSAGTTGDGPETEAETPLAAVEGSVLRQRMQKVRQAGQRFLRTNPAAYIGTECALHWNGASSLVELVKRVTEVLEAVGLRPGVDVCLGVSLDASEVHIQRSGTSGPFRQSDAHYTATAATTAATSTKGGKGGTNAASAAAANAIPSDTSGLYTFFAGEPPVTGEQLTEYYKEQMEEIGQGVVQFMEDTHATEDTVARQRLQQALQDAVFLAAHTSVEDAGAAGAEYAEHMTARALDAVCPSLVVDLARCGTVSTALSLFQKTRIRSGGDHLTSAVNATTVQTPCSALAVLISPAAGSAVAAAHLADVAVAGGASLLRTSTGPFSDITLSVVSRLAAIETELGRQHLLTPRVPFKRYNRYDMPPLPEVEVAPISHKGDKKKKDAQKGSLKKK